MPGLGRYPCPSCHYVAGNRRMLARHAVLIHSEKVFKCPLCPFITRYAANWYRHKRDLHGLTKVTNCEICGFFANSTNELAQHKESKHPEQLQLEKYEDKYAKEKLRLSENAEPVIKSEVVEELVTDVQPDDFLDIYNISSELDVNGNEDKATDSVTFSLPTDGLIDTSDENFHGGEDQSENGLALSSADSFVEPLRPLKVKRTYNCDQCGLQTGNPRIFLFHQRDVHAEKINIFECKYCIYASKHIQKLHRHCNLVHRPLLDKDPDYRKQLEANKKVKQPDMFNLGLVTQNNIILPSAPRNPILKKPPKKTQVFFNCLQCDYKTRNKSFLQHHEKTVHLKKRLYRCLQCGYVTNEKGRYSKHIKYHSLPKMQCQYCFFKTAYKWNMDRHMKNHEVGAEGAFRCNQCNFTTSTRQSFKSHITNHHNVNNIEEEEEEFETDNGPNDSAEWEDLDVIQIQDDEGSMSMEESMDSFTFSEPSQEQANPVWNNGQVNEKSLKCKSCDFIANWPFELKKHEEVHRNQKKHPCPLCGMRFEHIAWLAKHLRRVHQENSQAGSMADAYELMKPNRRKPKEQPQDPMLPMYQQILKPNIAPKPPQQANQNSMLSTLLNKPLNPSVPLSNNKYMYKSKVFASTNNMSRHVRATNYNETLQGSDASNIPVSKPKTVPTCNVCGCKTRWLSELQRHMRVHSQEKPFHCHKCKYHCKWKGDLNRHLMKYHGIKVPSSGKKTTPVSRLKFTRSNSISNTNNWPNISSDIGKTQMTYSTPLRKTSEEHPLDLTFKDSFSSACSNSDVYDPYEFDGLQANDSSSDPIIDLESEEANMGFETVPYKSPLQQLCEQPVPGEEPSPNPSTKRKYQCPFCTFGTTTASRFHVHIVQHYNRRPFMCSVCNHSSNWEWDITKHIRLKNCRDKYNNKACVLLTDETGRRNYDKYEKYLVDMNHQPTSPRIPVPNVSEPSCLPETDVRHSIPRPSYVEPPPLPQPPKTCSYDFRNIGSNFEDTPENIIVTPDINLMEPTETMESSGALYNQYNVSDNYGAKTNEAKFFICKHCDFKHATKRVVVSHLSLHTGIKPYRCRSCGICSNWRHVIVRHVKDAHNGYMNEVEDRISYVQEGYVLRLTPPGTTNTKEVSSFPQETNQNTTIFDCKLCPYKCDKEFYMKFHMKQHRPREGAIFKCDHCPYFVKFKKTLVRHVKLHEDPLGDLNEMNENSGISSTSSVSVESKALEVENDLVTLFAPQDSADDSIPISFDSLNQFTSETTSPRAKRHICEGCPYKTDNKTQYLYHKQFHRPNPSAPFKCTICSYWATMQHLLTQHMKVHETADDESEKSSPRQRQSRTTPERTRFEDDEDCGKMSVLYVKRGELVIKMFKCGYCPMMNKKKANVRVHQKMHGVVVNNGKFACSYCDYQCLNQGGLTNHLKIHQKVQEKLTIIEQHEVEQENSRKRPLDTSAEDAYGRKKVTYTCTRCPAIFKTLPNFENHLKFHGSFLPYPCDHCDYRARHKPHLLKHMLVHNPDYPAKQNASQKMEGENGFSSTNDDIESSNVSIVKKIDQMLLLEASELNAALKKTGYEMSNLHRCILCPAVFIKAATLVYHVSLHGSDGQYKCSQCDYAVNRSPNLTAHLQVHPKKNAVSRTPVKKPPPAKKLPLKTFPCPKCPAVFYKQDRFDRHFNLHGKNWKFVCGIGNCDYSVRFAANLIKHKKIHLTKNESENTAPANLAENCSPVTPAAVPLAENVIYDYEDKKLMYICDRCPYTQNRKDAVQSHMRRHWLRDGFQCPYCDYSSMQSGFLQTHIRTHIQSNPLFPAQCFMKFESFKIWSKDEKGDDVVLFDDENMTDDKEEEEDVSSDSEETEYSEQSKTRRLSCDSSTTDSNYSESKARVPVVVLSDIFTSKSKSIKKWVPKLKIPKIKITKSSSNEKMYTKINISEYDEDNTSNSSNSKSKPSLVVKISKVEGLNNHEKARYSISTKTSDNSFSSIAATSSADSCSSGAKVCDSETSKPDSVCVPTPVDNKVPEDGPAIEMDSNSSSTCEINPALDSTSGAETTVPFDASSSPSNGTSVMESNESLVAVKVPLSDASCDKSSDFSGLSFGDELLSGLGKTHLTNGLNLIAGEIQVDL